MWLFSILPCYLRHNCIDFSCLCVFSSAETGTRAAISCHLMQVLISRTSKNPSMEWFSVVEESVTTKANMWSCGGLIPPRWRSSISLRYYCSRDSGFNESHSVTLEWRDEKVISRDGRTVGYQMPSPPKMSAVSGLVSCLRMIWVGDKASVSG